MRACFRCNESKPEECFSGTKRFSSLLCRPCRTKFSQAAYRSKNQDKLRVELAEWRAANVDKYKAQRRRYYEKNTDAIRKRSRDYRDENLEICKRRLAEWRKANPDKVRAHVAKRYALKCAATVTDFTADDLAARWEYYGHRCWICGAPAMETDHVKPLTKGGAHMLCNLRPACTTCNTSKGNKWPYDPLQRKVLHKGDSVACLV